MCPRWCKCALMWHRSSNFEKGSYGRHQFDSYLILSYVYVCGMSKLTLFQSHCLSTLHRGGRKSLLKALKEIQRWLIVTVLRLPLAPRPKDIDIGYLSDILSLCCFFRTLVKTLRFDILPFFRHCCFSPLSGNLHILSPLRSFSWRTEGSLWSRLGISPST